MFKLIIAAACAWLVAMPLSAMAESQAACQQRCLQNTSGKGQASLTKCEQRCAVHGSARR